jgi:hypothetical protein
VSMLVYFLWWQFGKWFARTDYLANDEI